LASAGGLFARALPVVLLTVLVFFNGYVWAMATKIEYRAEFLDPLIDDLRFTLVARNRYHAHIGR
jgi:hypothetical protein